MRLLACALVLAFCGARTAHADAAYDACVGKTQTNPGFAECGGAWLKRADAALNAVWKQTYGAATGQTAKDLLDEQRLWNAFKEKSCDFYANGDWGREGEVLSYFACRAGVIEARTKQLRQYGKDIGPQ